MPALVAPLFGFAFGVLFAWVVGGDSARISRAARSKGLPASFAFGVLVFAPAAGYLLSFFPDWSYAYWVASEQLGSAPQLLLVLADAGAPAVGFLVATRFATSRQNVAVVRLAGVPALAGFGLLLAHAGRLRTFGTYAQYHGDFGLEPISGSPLGYAVLLTGLVVALGSAWTARYLAQVSSHVGD